jgi:hypothetical protein
MFIRITIYALLFFLYGNSHAQTNIQYENKDYVDHVKSVRFHAANLGTYYPIVGLNTGGGSLQLSFDDLNPGDARTFKYTVIHCDSDWKPSQLSYFEYLDRFEEGDMNDYQFSFQTAQPYVHYRLFLPNRDINWTLSGNYLLFVYEEEPDKPILTRRFIVAEQIVNILPQMAIPGDISKNRTHHEIDFVVNHEGIDFRNARNDISATVLQNGRWDNAVMDIPPYLERSGEILDFNYQNRISFEAGREWRQIDLRSLRFPSADIADVTRYDDGFFVTLLKDLKRAGNPYSGYNDLNGAYVIENKDMNNEELTSEYCKVLFSLYSPTKYENQDIYLFGAMSNWELKKEFKMAYNEQYDSYMGNPMLKQGFYSYQYVIVDKDGNKDFETLEGNDYQTENEYTIIIYYHPFGARYDQVIAAQTFESDRI